MTKSDTGYQDKHKLWGINSVQGTVAPYAQKHRARQSFSDGTGASNSLQVCGTSSGDGCQRQLIAFWK